MTQVDEINSFFQDILQSLKINNNQITKEDIYSYFQNYGIPKDYQNMKIIDNQTLNINQSLEEGANFGKIKVDLEYHEYWQFFKTSVINDGRKYDFKYKVYIPTTPETHGLIAKNVCTYLADNNIVSDSKFAKSYRSDSIIVNLTNTEDFNKLVTYITTNFYNYLGKVQPFIPTYGGIGVIVGNDKSNSYSERLAKYLEIFITSCKNNNRLDLINFDGFLETLQDSLINNRTSNPDEAKQILTHLTEVSNLSKTQQNSNSQKK